MASFCPQIERRFSTYKQWRLMVSSQEKLKIYQKSIKYLYDCQQQQR